MLLTPKTRHLLVSAALVCLWAAPAAAKPEFVIKFATVAPDGTPWAKQLQRMRKLMHKNTGGRVKVKAFTGFSKGGEKSLVRRCIQGSLQMCGVTVGAVATVVNDLNALELPYLFADDKEADRILDGPALPQIKKILLNKGLVFWCWSENGWRGFGSKKRPITKPADLKGMKMRSQESRVHVETFKALGANPVPIALPEVLGALQTGVVDGYDNTPLYLFAASWYQQTKYYTQTNHIYQPALILFNKRFYDKLPADLRQAVMKSAEEVTVYGRKLIRKIKTPLINNMKSAGIKVITPTAAQVAAFAKATRKVHPKIRRQLSPKGRRLLDIIYKAKKK
jgi:tripartite ATP-independent transporter DctP family solute receptor